MENWLKAMEYVPINENLDDLLAHLKIVSSPGTRKVWKHVVTHIRPKKESEIIKKQCLLHRLSTCNPPYFEIEVQLNCLKDFESYSEKKQDQSKLNNVLKQIEEKKKSIAERLKKFEHARSSSLLEEELLKESVFKLDHLKKKKKTVERLIQRFENDTEALKRLRAEPNKFVYYGSEVSNWERKVLIVIAELPPGIEFETIVLKMEELLKSSQLPALPEWDRTEALTEMENILLDKLKLLSTRQSELKEIDEKLKHTKNNVTAMIPQGNNISVQETNSLINSFEENILKEARSASELLVETKPLYVLQAERHTIRRFNHLIESKAKDISKWLPCENGDYNSAELPLPSLADVSLPARPLTRKLINSISKEVTAFLDLSLSQTAPDHVINYIEPCILSHNQYLQLKNMMKINSKLIALGEKISNINIPSVDDLSISSGSKNRMDEMCLNLSEKMKYLKSETEALEDVYERVKAAFNFLQKEPLNESLTGLLIENKDISYWLSRFTNAKKKHDHELWILNSNN